jgi:hypothetical protein
LKAVELAVLTDQQFMVGAVDSWRELPEPGMVEQEEDGRRGRRR